jgi:hypothetical protein
MIQYTKEVIEKLLQKYMDGTSTLDEEAILAQYFKGSNIPEEWLCYQQMFQEIEAMKPQPKANRRWAVWGVAAAAVVAGVLYLAVPQHHTQLVPTAPLVAKVDTTAMQSVESSGVQSVERVDTVAARPVIPDEAPQQPVKAKKRSLRKAEPTIHDYDKAYALMAQAEQTKTQVVQAKAQAEQVKAKMELFNAQMAAHGYVPVLQEDGTIIYINEQENLIAYEE